MRFKFNIKKLFIPASVVGTTIGVVVLFKDHIGGTRVFDNVKITGRTAIVTGATSGIGKEVAADLAKRGGRVLLACRDMEKCEDVKKKIIKDTFNLNVHCKNLDVSSMQSVRKFADDVIENESRVDILVNNAGVMGFKDKQITDEGFELHIGVNHLGPFLLTNLLLDKLKASAPSRIVNTGKVVTKNDSINLDDLNSDQAYSWEAAYGQSKLATLLFTKELAEKLKGTRVTAVCALPVLTNTDISRNLSLSKSYLSRIVLGPFLWLIQAKPVQGAQCTIHCAVDPSVPDKQEIFYLKSEPALKENPEFLSEENAKRLWLISERWTGLDK